MDVSHDGIDKVPSSWNLHGWSLLWTLMAVTLRGLKSPSNIVGFYRRCIACELKKILRAEHPGTCYGDRSQIVTASRVVPCSGSSWGSAYAWFVSSSSVLPRTANRRIISLEQSVAGSRVEVRRSGASAPPLTVSMRAGGTHRAADC